MKKQYMSPVMEIESAETSMMICESMETGTGTSGDVGEAKTEIEDDSPASIDIWE